MRSSGTLEETPVILRVSYILRNEESRPTFLDLMGELRVRTLRILSALGLPAGAYAFSEDPRHPGWFTEVFHFSSPQQYERFDEQYTDDRAAVAIQTLLENTIDPNRSDYVVTRSVAGRR
jgi:hypothetical protein